MAWPRFYERRVRDARRIIALRARRRRALNSLGLLAAADRPGRARARARASRRRPRGRRFLKWRSSAPRSWAGARQGACCSGWALAAAASRRRRRGPSGRSERGGEKTGWMCAQPRRTWDEMAHANARACAESSETCAARRAAASRRRSCCRGRAGARCESSGGRDLGEEGARRGRTPASPPSRRRRRLRRAPLVRGGEAEAGLSLREHARAACLDEVGQRHRSRPPPPRATASGMAL